jgi:pyridoxal phosphate enzyme (YggS family)
VGIAGTRVISLVMSFSDLSERVAEVRTRIAESVRRGGHGQQVRLVAVTKTHGPEAVEAAWTAGVADVGENKVQEAVAKQDALATSPATRGGMRWHLIGHVQSNKVKWLLRFHLLHSLDRESLVAAVDAIGRSGDRPVDALVQVNVVQEETKGGFAMSDIDGLAMRLRERPGIRVTGVMTMAPLEAGERVLRQVFAGAREAAKRLRDAGHPATELSMGMSQDFEVAVEEGATLVRLGTVLFGARG